LGLSVFAAATKSGRTGFFSWVHAEKIGSLGFVGCLQNSLLTQYWLYFAWSQIVATKLPSQRCTALDGLRISNAYAIRGHRENYRQRGYAPEQNQ
jgi:hypothetical protein